jgi:hypothetical protein
MSINENDWEVKFSLSKLLFEDNQFDEAIELLEEVIQIHYEPEMDMHLGVYYASKGEQIGKEAVTQMGYFDEDKISSIASPFLKKAVFHLDKYRKKNVIDKSYFDQVCNMFDQLSPGSLQKMQIPLSLSRIHRVLIGDCRIEPPQEIIETEFVCKKTIKSAFLTSCVAGTNRNKAMIYLYETDDTEKITSGDEKPCSAVNISFPGFDDPSVPTCHVSEY